MEDNKELEKQIIVDDDSDMPAPETKEYSNEKYVKLSDRFLELFNDVVQELPYVTLLTNHNKETIHLIDLVRYVEANWENMPLSMFSNVIDYIANLKFKYNRALMEEFEDKELQKKLYEIKK